MRPDLEIIVEWIRPGARVLDLGCGDGTLLHHLSKTRQVTGYGMEIDPDNLVQCVNRGVNVIQLNLDAGLADFDDASFDYVIMTQTLQAVRYPVDVLKEILRVGTEGIVTFPNFGHWQSRIQLMFQGRMPVTRVLPSTWYNTPNIHLCTLTDFENLCREQDIHVLERTVVDHEHKTSMGMRMLPRLLGEIALYRFRRK